MFNCNILRTTGNQGSCQGSVNVLCLLYMAPIYTTQHGENGNTRHSCTRFNTREIVIQTSLICFNTPCDVVIHASHMKTPKSKCGLYTTTLGHGLLYTIRPDIWFRAETKKVVTCFFYVALVLKKQLVIYRCAVMRT